MYETQINTWALVGVLLCTGSAMAEMNGLTFDHIENGAIDGACTVRVYAELDAGNRLDAG